MSDEELLMQETYKFVYFISRLCISIFHVYSTDICDCIKENFNESNKKIFFEIFIATIDEYIETKTMSERFADNIVKFLNDYRSEKISTEETNFINTALVKINGVDFNSMKNVKKYYLEEYGKRYIKIYFPGRDIVSIIDNSFFFDTMMLMDYYAKGSIVFEQLQKDNDPINNKMFYGTINVLLDECPLYFKDKEFLINVLKILKENLTLYKETNDTKIFKACNKLLKKFEKTFIK